MVIIGDILSGMKTYISLLRGVNVSGKNRISMPDLKRLYESLGLVDVVTYIQSGNVVFDTGEIDQTKIIKLIEEGLTRSLGGDVRVILRDRISLKRIIDNNPFIIKRKEDPERLYVTCLSGLPVEAALKNITAAGDGGGSNPRLNNTWAIASDQDEFIIHGKEVYLFCPNGYGKTKFSNTFFEKKLNITATTRNWKTVNSLYEIAERR
jgi:Uncharacterized protein conserved in bacteria